MYTTPSQNLNIFISSPGDLSDERIFVRNTILDLHVRVYRGRISLLPQMSEDFAAGTGAYTQHVINQQTVPFGLYIGMFWNRFGTRTEEFGSGTEEEFNNAIKLRERLGTHVVLLRCSKQVDAHTLDEEQLRRVRDFMSKNEKHSFIQTFSDEHELRKRIEDAIRVAVDEIEEQQFKTNDFSDDFINRLESAFDDFKYDITIQRDISREHTDEENERAFVRLFDRHTRQLDRIVQDALYAISTRPFPEFETTPKERERIRSIGNHFLRVKDKASTKHPLTKTEKNILNEFSQTLTRLRVVFRLFSDL